MNKNSQNLSGECPDHTCPWWLGFVLANPIRKLIEDPKDLVLPLINDGTRVLELGPAMGFFSLPVAKAVGVSGKLVCVELQESMIRSLKERLEKRGLLGRCELRRCELENLGLEELEGRMDLVLAIHVVHETLKPEDTIAQLSKTLRPGGKLFLMEPRGHCSEERFRAEEDAALKSGMLRIEHPTAKLNRRKLVSLWEKQ